jgi:hypothetical protein
VAEHGPQRALGVAGLGDDVQAAGLVEQEAQAGPDHGVVVGEDDGDVAAVVGHLLGQTISESVRKRERPAPMEGGAGRSSRSRLGMEVSRRSALLGRPSSPARWPWRDGAARSA